MMPVLFGLFLTLVCALVGFMFGRGARKDQHRREEISRAVAKPETPAEGEAPVPQPSELPGDSRRVDSVPKGLE